MALGACGPHRSAPHPVPIKRALAICTACDLGLDPTHALKAREAYRGLPAAGFRAFPHRRLAGSDYLSGLIAHRVPTVSCCMTSADPSALSAASEVPSR